MASMGSFRIACIIHSLQVGVFCRDFLDGGRDIFRQGREALLFPILGECPDHQTNIDLIS